MRTSIQILENTSMDLGIAGKVAIVTGGSRGLGRHSALALAREGVHIAICARTESALLETTKELKDFGTKVLGITVDITDSEAIEPFHKQVVSELGEVDILVNNVGGSRGRTVMETTDDQLTETFNLNLYGALRLIKRVVPGMQERHWGRIINIASIYGREYGGGSSYMAAKAALIAVSKHMGLTMAQDGILVNTVAPGSIAFPGGGWERFQAEQSPEVVREFIERNLPMGKFGWPEPVGDLVAFLSSDRAGLITGACIVVDGGQSYSMI